MVTKVNMVAVVNMVELVDLIIKVNFFRFSSLFGQGYFYILLSIQHKALIWIIPAACTNIFSVHYAPSLYWP